MSLDFYVKGVGFRILFSRKDPLFARLELNDAQLILEKNHSEARFAGRARAPRGRGMGLQIEVPGVGVARSRLVALGVRPFRGLRRIWYEAGTQGAGLKGRKEFVVQDPDRYLIRLVEVL